MKVNGLLNNGILKLFERNISRGRFLKFAAAGAAYLLIQTKAARYAFAKASGQSLKPRTKRKAVTDCDMAVVRGDNPSAITRKALDLLGGMSRFVKPGDVVVIKPNIGWDRNPEQAGNTNPLVVAELVKMAKDSGAKVVKVFDRTCNDARRTYQSSGIMEAAKKAGAVVYYADDWKFYPALMPAGYMMSDWPIFRDAVECDCFINVPIAKNHGLTGLTLSMKNLMGVCGGMRGRMHWDIDQKLAEITEFIKPDLNVVDAFRILLRNGPTGGNLKDVEVKKMVIATADPVLADAYAATLFGLRPSDVGCVPIANKMGLGNMDLTKADIKQTKI